MIDPKWIIQLKGKDYPQWPGILDAATRAGLRKLTTTLIQAPCPENGQLAIVLAHAVFEDGREFEDLGDAGPQNCSPQIASAAVRMASTRAKGRCLRDALNVGQTMWEELPDEERQAAPVGANGSARRPAVVSDQPAEPAPLSAGADIAIKHGPVCISCEVPLTANVYRAAMKHLRQPMCETCGKQELRRQADERLAAEAAAAAS